MHSSIEDSYEIDYNREEGRDWMERVGEMLSLEEDREHGQRSAGDRGAGGLDRGPGGKLADMIVPRNGLSNDYKEKRQKRIANEDNT